MEKIQYQNLEPDEFNTEDVELVDLLEVDILQKIQESFSKMARMATLITDEEGKAITEGSGFSTFCTEYCRKSEIGRKRCEECDKKGALMSLEKGGAVTYHCHAGLMDFAAPIMLKDKIIGSIIGGQVLPEEPDLTEMGSYADELGVDREGFIEAAKHTNIVPEAAINRNAEFLYEFSGVISEMAYKSYVSQRLGKEAMIATTLKSDFLANMSHEIRTPLNAILGMAELAMRVKLPIVAYEYINQIVESGNILLAIINDILDFSKIESGKMDIIEDVYDPIATISELSNILVTRIGDKNIELIVDIDNNIPEQLYGDDVRLKQIIMNLANNAIKFTQNGMVAIRLYCDKQDDGKIILMCNVQDTGIGIKKQDYDKLFESFQQLDSKRNRNIEGTGLGLAITNKLIGLMDGHISVDSVYGEGSTFSIDIPQKVISAAPAVDTDVEKVRVAAYIANPYMYEQLKKDVKKFGMEFISISNYDEAEAAFDSGNNGFLFVSQSLYTTEISMFAKEHPNVTVCVITANFNAINIDTPNVIEVKKPVSVMNLNLIFRHEKLIGRNTHEDECYVEFIAPDAHVLIVDDNEINMTVALGLLEPLKLQIDVAYSGKEAIERVSTKRYDLIFMDHMMPEIDGVETTHIIRRFFPDYSNVPIIALTANVVNEAKEMFIKEGMNDLVAKPIEFKKIAAKIKKWLPDSYIKSPDVTEKSERIAPDVEDKVEYLDIPGLDQKYAIELLGSMDLYKAVLRDYYVSLPRKIELIKQYEMSENIKEFTVEVHAMKSSSRQVGAIDLANKAENLEMLGNKGDIQSIHKLTDDMLIQCNYYYELLADYFFEEKCDEEEKPVMDPEQLKFYFSNIKIAIEDFDVDVTDKIIEDMKNYRFDNEQADLFVSLDDANTNLDSELVIKIIDEWEKLL